MFKRILITLIALIVMIGALSGIKMLQFKRMAAFGEGFAPPPAVVTTATVQEDSWEAYLTAVGSLEAVRGVEVTAELTGKVTRIAFEAGSQVKAGTLLIQQDISVESAELKAAEAEVTLAKLELDRARKLLNQKSISQAELDKAEARFQQAVAQKENARAVIAKKTIRAPFTGRLGIRQVNLGQVLNEGDAIVSLQSLDPLYVNFLLPQQHLPRIKLGYEVRLKSNAFPEQTISGKITAVNPQVEAATRNIRVQATVTNPDEWLRPGMFVNVAVVLPGRKEVLTIPATSVLYAPYGDSVFIVEEKKDEKKNASVLLLRQQFVRLGEKRGDYVSILSGLKPEEVVVSSGVFKLRNGQGVVIDNKLAPEFKEAPTPEDA